MNLRLREQRIDDGADVVDHGIAVDAHRARVRIDFDFRDVAPVRETGDLGRERADALEPDAELAGNMDRHERHLRDLLEGHFLVGAGDHELAVRELDVGGVGFHEVGRELLAALDHLVGRGAERAAADHHRAGGISAASDRHLVRVGLGKAHILDRDVEPFGEHLGEGCLVALAVGQHARHDRDRPAGIEADLHSLVEDAGVVHVIDDAAAALETLGLRRGLARLVPVPIGEATGLVERRRVVTRVVGPARQGGVRHLVGRDEVDASQLRPIDAGLARGDVDQPLHDVHGFGAPCATVGDGRCRVREDGLVDHVHVGDVVHGRSEFHGEQDRDRARPLDIGPDIVQRMPAQRDELAVLVERELGLDRLVATVVVAHQGFAAGCNPFHRSLDALARPCDDGLLGIDMPLHPESAAHILGHHADHALGHIEVLCREALADAMHVLGAGVEGEAPGAGVEIAKAAARLHGHRVQAVVVQLEARDVVGVLDRRIGIVPVAEPQREADVVRRLRIDEGRTVLDGIGCHDDRR